MAVVVKFSDKDGGPPLKVTVPCPYGDYVLSYLGTTCVATARKKGERFIKDLKKENK